MSVVANGNEDGRILYDGFGMVMTNTLSAELTDTLIDTPDAATGLVYLGGGRWYDPALGRPLQPNPAGSPPTVPQALNRYTATPLGQPGVYEAVASSQWYDALEVFGCCQLFDFAVDSGALVTGRQLGLEAYLTSRTASVVSSGGKLPHFARNLNAQGGVRIRQGDFLPASPHSNAIINENRMRWLQKRLGNETLLLSEPGKWNKLMNWERRPIASHLGLSVKKVSAGEALAGGAVGFVFDAGWQAVQDWGNPYLTPWQKGQRAFITGGVGFIAGIGVVALVGTGPIGFSGALIVGWLVEAPINNWIFQSFRLVPTRNLAPLQ